MLTSLLSIPVLCQLLSQDVVLHASVVRELVRGISFADFVKNDGVVVGSVAAPSQPYVERILYPCTTFRSVEEACFKMQKVRYTIFMKDLGTFTLVMGYLPNSGTVFPSPDIDVNMLSLSRSGLFVRNHTDTTVQYQPIPLLTLVKKCQERRFLVSAFASPVNQTLFAHSDQWVLKRILNLRDRGWAYEGSKIKVWTSPHANACCSICQGNNGPEWVQTCCDHVFHHRCWDNYVDHEMSKWTDTTFNLQQDHFIKCPMCRHAIRSFEALSPPLNEDSNHVPPVGGRRRGRRGNSGSATRE